MKKFFVNIPFVLKIFIAWRLLLFVPLVFSYYLIPYRTGSEFTNLWSKISPYFPVNNFLLWPWTNFDGIHYLSIAGNGYTFNARFFPLFPILINLLSKPLQSLTPFGSVQFFSGFIISNLSFLLSLFIFYKLIQIDFSKKVAQKTIFYLLIFPASFFFVAIYSESLFLLLTLLSFYFARKGNWLASSIFAMFLTATRLVGLAIFPALIFEYLLQKGFFSRDFSKLKFSKEAIYLFFIPTGLLSYIFFNQLKWGNALQFIYSQGDLANSRSVNFIVFPLQTVFRYIKIFVNLPVNQFEWWVALFEFAIFFLVSFLLYIAWIKKIRRSYLFFSLVAFLIPVLSGTFSGLPRYSLVLFPIFITLSIILNKKIQLIYSIFSIVILILLVMLFSRGYYIS